MGKKDKKKKGKGAEKTAAKTEKKETNKLKKKLAAIGEDDVEAILAQLEKDEQKKNEIKIVKVDPPSRRINFSFVAHPDKEDLILFGGEFFNGQKTFLYNELFFYNIPSDSWSLIKSPPAPPPRCGHQMVASAANKGELWLFGGEFASPTQSQFYHYRDLWLFRFESGRWEKIDAPNGPSARSGHRMVHFKKQLVVFGGFHDNLRDYKYFNDVYSFSTETYRWSKLEVAGTPPAPRSSCCMATLSDGKILIYGGYSKEKIKKDVDKGHTYTDAFLLAPDKNDPSKWKWTQSKLGGLQVSQRSGMSIALAQNNTAYVFGGVVDVDEEEDIRSTFLNELYQLDLGALAWRNVALSGKKEKDVKSRRRKQKELEGTEEDHMEVDSSEVEEVQVVADDGVFTVTVGPSALGEASKDPDDSSLHKIDLFRPSPRMNCGLTIKHGTLYLYGGMFEDGDKQLTLSDFYSLDLRKFDEWKVLIKDDRAQEWMASGSESSDDDDSSESDDDSEMETN